MSRTTGFLRVLSGRATELRLRLGLGVFGVLWEKKRKAKAMEAARAMEVMRRRAMKTMVVEGLRGGGEVVVRRAVDWFEGSSSGDDGFDGGVRIEREAVPIGSVGGGREWNRLKEEMVGVEICWEVVQD